MVLGRRSNSPAHRVAALYFLHFPDSRGVGRIVLSRRVARWADEIGEAELGRMWDGLEIEDEPHDTAQIPPA